MTITSVDSDLGRFPPLKEGHPAIGRICPGCDEPILAGDIVAFVNGRPDGPVEQEKSDAGRAYIAEVDLAHERCAFA